MRRDTFKRHALCFLCTPAVLFILALYALVIATWLRIGHWPYYGHPDAGSATAPFFAAHVLIGWLFMLAGSSVSLGVLLGIMAKRWGLEGLFRYSLYNLWTWILIWILIVLDPGRFLMWFLD